MGIFSPRNQRSAKNHATEWHRSALLALLLLSLLLIRQYLACRKPKLRRQVTNVTVRGGSGNFHMGRPVKGPSKFWVGQQEWCMWGRISFG